MASPLLLSAPPRFPDPPRWRGPGALAGALLGSLVRKRVRIAAALCVLGIGGAVGCARPERDAISAEVVDRDRLTRSELTAQVAADHVALADLIASDRFAELEAVYADPALREIALRLIERNRALRRLDETNVLPPGAP